jgi:hypothetical protein
MYLIAMQVLPTHGSPTMTILMGISVSDITNTKIKDNNNIILYYFYKVVDIYLLKSIQQ